MNRIRAIAIVLSMALFLLGAAGNTDDKTTGKDVSYDGIKQRQTTEICEGTVSEVKEQEPEMEPVSEPESVPVPEPEEEQIQRTIDITDADYAALLKLVEAEASGEDLKGKMLVANVVINRLGNGAFGSTVQEVIYQRVNGKAQFSPVATGKIDRVVVSKETIEAVEQVLCGADESQGALYFVARAHADPVNMAWFDNNLTWLFQHHGHEFYV